MALNVSSSESMIIAARLEGEANVEPLSQGLEQTKQQLADVGQIAEQIAEKFAGQLSASFDQLNTSLSKISDNLRDTQQGISEVGSVSETTSSSVSSLGSALGGLSLALVALAADATVAAGELERLQLATDALASVKGIAPAAMDKYVQGAREMGLSTQEANRAILELLRSDVPMQNWLQIIQTALNAGEVSTWGFNRALDALTTSIRTGYTRGIKRLGIFVDESDEKMQNATAAAQAMAEQLGATGEEYDKILAAAKKQQREAGSAVDKQLMLNAILRESVKLNGVFEQSYNSLSGQTQRFTRSINDLVIAFGNALLPIAEAVLKPINAFLDIIKQIPEPLQKVVSYLVTLGGVIGAIKFAPGFLTNLPVVGSLFAGLGSVLAVIAPWIPVVIAGVLALVGAITAVKKAWDDNIAGFRDKVMPAIEWLIDKFQRLQDILEFHGQRISVIFGEYWQRAIDVINTIIERIKEFINTHPELLSMVEATWQFIQDVITTAIYIIDKALFALESVLKGDWAGAWKYIAEAGKAALGLLGVAIVDFGSNMFNWGWNLISELANGIISAAGSVLVQAITWVGNLIGSFFEGHSPPLRGPLSHIVEWGTNLVDQLIVGIRKAEPAKQIDDILQALLGIGSAVPTGTSPLDIISQIPTLEEQKKIIGTITQGMIDQAQAAVDQATRDLEIFNNAVYQFIQLYDEEVLKRLAAMAEEALKRAQANYNKAKAERERYGLTIESYDEINARAMMEQAQSEKDRTDYLLALNEKRKAVAEEMFKEEKDLIETRLRAAESYLALLQMVGAETKKAVAPVETTAEQAAKKGKEETPDYEFDFGGGAGLTPLEDTLNEVKERIKNAYITLRDRITGMGDKVVGFLQDVGDTIVGWIMPPLTSIANWITTVGQGLWETVRPDLLNTKTELWNFASEVEKRFEQIKISASGSWQKLTTFISESLVPVKAFLEETFGENSAIYKFFMGTGGEGGVLAVIQTQIQNLWDTLSDPQTAITNLQLLYNTLAGLVQLEWAGFKGLTLVILDLLSADYTQANEDLRNMNTEMSNALMRIPQVAISVGLFNLAMSALTGPEGALTKANTELTNLQNTAGSVFRYVKEKFDAYMKPAIDGAQVGFADVKKAFEDFSTSISSRFPDLAKTFQSVKDLLNTIADKVPLVAGLLGVLAEVLVFLGLKNMAIPETTINVFSTLVDILEKYLSLVESGLIISLRGGGQAIGDIFKILGSGVGTELALLEGIYNILVDLVTLDFNRVGTDFENMVNKMATAIQDQWVVAGDLLMSPFNALFAFLTGTQTTEGINAQAGATGNMPSAEAAMSTVAQGDLIQTWISSMITSLGTGVETLKTAVFDFFTDAIFNAFFEGFIGTTGEGGKAATGGLVASVLGWLVSSEKGQPSVLNSIVQAKDVIFEKMKWFVKEGIWVPFQQQWGILIEDVKVLVSDLWDKGIGPMLENVINKFIDAINSMIDAVNGITGAIGIPAIPSIGGVSLPTIGYQANYPVFGQGGLVTVPTMAMVGDTGPEVIIPLSKFNQFMAEVGGGGNMINIYNSSASPITTEVDFNELSNWKVGIS
jgi:hypothetical protein